MNVHALIDQFVAHVAWTGGIFQPTEQAPWIEELEQRLPRPFPPSFRSLVTRYAFTPFDAGGLSLYANTGTNDPDEMCVAIFRDRFIAEPTLKSGYIPFARPDTGSYDPVCFDTESAASRGEYPVVRLDHELLLWPGRIRVLERVAVSFYAFAADIVNFA